MNTDYIDLARIIDENFTLKIDNKEEELLREYEKESKCQKSNVYKLLVEIAGTVDASEASDDQCRAYLARIQCSFRSITFFRGIENHRKNTEKATKLAGCVVI